MFIVKVELRQLTSLRQEKAAIISRIEQDLKNKKGKSRYCNKIGHWEKDRRIKISDQERVKRI